MLEMDIKPVPAPNPVVPVRKVEPGNGRLKDRRRRQDAESADEQHKDDPIHENHPGIDTYA